MQFVYTIRHLWWHLSGLSLQLSSTRLGYEWLVRMWTGAFTSILIETVVAWNCVAWFPGWHRGAVKNWKRRQICYPHVAPGSPLEQHPFMYNRATLKIMYLSCQCFHTLARRCSVFSSKGACWVIVIRVFVQWETPLTFSPTATVKFIVPFVPDDAFEAPDLSNLRDSTLTYSQRNSWINICPTVRLKRIQLSSRANHSTGLMWPTTFFLK